MMHVLYLSHDGALDPLGQSQIVPYLQRLAGPEIRITLLSFEKSRAAADRQRVQRLRAALRASHIAWVPLRYHNRPPILSTVWDMAHGFARAWWIARAQRVDLIHARSYVGACMALWLKRLTGAKVLFDMRELWVDGRVDGGAWRRGGWLHRMGKRCERWCLLTSDAIVSLTEAGKQIILRFDYWTPEAAPITVIPTCVDVDRFAERDAVAHEPPAAFQGRRVIAYLGSVGTWYRLDDMIDCYTVIARKSPEALLLILTPQADEARQRCVARGLEPGQFDVRTVTHEAVPEYLRWAEVALYFITPSYAKRSSCPTKLGESLASGLPVLTNAGVGDQDALLREARVGVLVDSFTSAAYAQAWDEMTALLAEGPALRRRCRQAAQERLGLEAGAATYRRIYHELCGTHEAAHPLPVSA